MNLVNMVKALSLECLTNYIVVDTPHNCRIMEKIGELDEEYKNSSKTGQIAILATIYDLCLAMDVI